MSLTPDQLAEIEAARATPRPTLRAVSEGMEAHLYRAHEVLDHGFIRVIDYMGDDAAIVQAARVSYGAGTKHVQNDEGLIRYLMRHWHSTPFEMCEIKLHVKLPVFVARQWIRHRTANVNEYSARYSILDREFYIPAPEHLAAVATLFGHAAPDPRTARVLELGGASGGNVIPFAVRNPGGEALNSYLHSLAATKNPIGLLGAIYIIEGTGQRIVPALLPLLRKQVDLPASAFRFLEYHGTNDEHHLARWLAAVELVMAIDPNAANAIITTAKRTAQLYLMQFEHILES